MSPEQAEGSENLDGRADVFALGAMFYECLTGVVPFNGPSAPLILLAIITKSPQPLSTLGLGFPPVLDDVLDDAIAKKAATRTAKVGEFVDGIGQAFGLEGTHMQWASQSVDAIRSQFRVVAAPARVVNADPFAQGAVSDPFAATPPAADPRFAMDAAFRQQNAPDYADSDTPLTRRPPWLWIGVGAAALIALIVLIVALASR
jgi:serine/threonine protein kinase